MPIKIELSQQEKNIKIQEILDKYTSRNTLESPIVPGVVAGYATEKEIKYVGASGVLKHTESKARGENVADSQTDLANKMETDSLFLLWSTTKAVTVTALFQLIERGLVGLHDPVEKYLPEFEFKKVIKSMDYETAEMELEELHIKPTIHHLTTHTAGFGYFFFNKYYKTIMDMGNSGNVLNCTYREFDNVPLSFQPGTRWEYGTNIDFVGAIVMKVSGLSLEEYFQKNIFDKCDIHTMKFNLVDEKDHQTLSNIHIRDTTDPTKFIQVTEKLTPSTPDFECGGHGMFGTVGDYLKFLQIFINDGVSPITKERILSHETLVNHAFKDQLKEMALQPGNENCYFKDLPSTDAAVTNPVSVYPGVKKGWTNFFMINEEYIEQVNRPKNSLMWCGLANLYYVINLEKKLVMYWAESVFPFADISSFTGFSEFEKFVNTEC
ncbi:hypothetical protein ACO0RG_003297 [Hanseniaspora osmophila]